MNCPRCESAVLDERDRDGITVDVCRTCRGIWLDRGELERLIARASEDRNHFEQHRGYAPRERGGERSHGPDSDAYDHRKQHRKRSWLETLTDVFD